MCVLLSTDIFHASHTIDLNHVAYLFYPYQYLLISAMVFVGRSRSHHVCKKIPPLWSTPPAQSTARACHLCGDGCDQGYGIKDASSSGRFLKEVQRTGHVVIGDRSERRKDFIRLQNEYSLVK